MQKKQTSQGYKGKTSASGATKRALAERTFSAGHFCLILFLRFVPGHTLNLCKDYNLKLQVLSYRAVCLVICDTELVLSDTDVLQLALDKHLTTKRSVITDYNDRYCILRVQLYI